MLVSRPFWFDPEGLNTLAYGVGVDSNHRRLTFYSSPLYR
jgi:hypothetical protein